jgi:hypothetical protein
VDFTPNDTTNYRSTSADVKINVLKAMPTITWSNPADIIYGTAPGGTQLNATASVAGSFVYTPPAGTVLSAGDGQTLSVAFTPTDTTNYSNASKTVAINVLKATPTITWNNPANINYGTALNGTQLNATTLVTGSFVYTPSAGTVISVGSGQALSVLFTPSDMVNYNDVTKMVTINVLKSGTTTTLTSSANPSTIGQPLTFTATVVSSSATGSVEFIDGAASLVSVPLSGGSASITIAAPAVGGHSIKAVYSGDGNYYGSTSAILSESVKYNFSGFFAPVDNPNVVNKANAGQAIPVKWLLQDATGAGIGDTASFVNLTSYQVSCGTFAGDPASAIEEYAAGSSGLQYQGNGNWQFNWKTPKTYAGACRTMVLTLHDGSTHTAYFQYK